MNNKFITFIILLSVLILFNVFMIQADEAYVTATKNGITFSWKISGKMLDVKVSAPAKGWIAVGIDPDFIMKNADFIIGYVKDGKVFVSDEFGTEKAMHETDESLGGKSDVVNIKGTETDKSTELSFSIPLDSGDKFDKKILPGKHNIILAYSKSDDFTSEHKRTAKIRIEIKY